MARCYYDKIRIWTFPYSCVHLMPNSGQCDACITIVFEKQRHEAMRDIFYRETRKDMKRGTIFYREISCYGMLWHCEISCYNIVPPFVSRRKFAILPILWGPMFHNYGITRILLGTHARCKCFFNGECESSNSPKMAIFLIYISDENKIRVGWSSHFLP
jgi:hypothetical protein